MPQAYGGQTVTDSAQILPGVIVDSDINASAAIAYSKLALALGIVNADVSATAAIVDTKLAQIATASKVSGAALTLLANIPAGAGVIPAANVPPGATTNSQGVTTKQGSDASGSQVIAHGLAGTPTKVRFTITENVGTEMSFSVGAWSAAGNHGMFSGVGSSSGHGTSSTYSAIINAHNGGANLYQGGTVAVDATNITITWTQINGGDAGVRRILWEATL